MRDFGGDDGHKVITDENLRLMSAVCGAGAPTERDGGFTDSLRGQSTALDRNSAHK